MPERARPGGLSQSVRRRALARSTIVLACAAVAVAAVFLGAWTAPDTEAVAPEGAVPGNSALPRYTSIPRPTPSALMPPVPVLTFDRGARSVDDPGSLWVVVNKQRPLGPSDYAPPDLVTVPVPHTWQPQLRQEASAAAVAMFAAAREEAGLNLASNSAYRGFAAQTRVYDAAVAARGIGSADSSIARPGSSEHQTGLALDVGAESGRCSLNACFGDTPEGVWLADNAVRFGFLLRYPADKVAVTGYEFEPWHFRFIGADLAAQMETVGVTTLEEFFGFPAAPGYP